MKVRWFIILVTGFAALLTWAGLSLNSSPAQEKAEKRGQEIPLKTVYCTSGQKGMQPVVASFTYDEKGHKKPSAPYYEALSLLRKDLGCGASNVFLVRGKDITEAITATAHVFLDGGTGVEEPVTSIGREKSADIWMGAFLGRTGISQMWEIQSVVRNKEFLQVRYSRPPEPGVSLALLGDCFVWVPLGQAPPGDYILSLFDTQKGAVTLMRRVSVTK